MKILGLLRHAKSDWDDTAQRDFDRGLNARGKKGAELIGKHIRDHGVKWDRLIASPMPRHRGRTEYAGALIDVTASKQSEEALFHSQATLGP